MFNAMITRGMAAAAGLCLLAAPAMAQDAKAEWAAQAALLAYDNQADLQVREVGVEKRGGASVRDITFVPLPGRAPVKAYIVTPDGPGPFAGILWVHWLGDPETTNRTQFLGEAVGLAPKGIASVLVDAMWSDPKWYGGRVLAEDRANSIRQAVAIRRAMDLLVRQPGVDQGRLGFVGHDYGGMYGMLAAGADQRAKAYVYIAVTQSLNDWAFFANQPPSKAEYLRANADLELTDYLRQVKNASTLLQYGEKDEYVSQADTIPIVRATAEPKERRLYDSDHSMKLPRIAEERALWLVEKLTGPPAPLPAGR